MSEAISSPPLVADFGEFGGRYVAETLMPAVEALAEAWPAAWRDESFQADYQRILKEYVGRPSALTPARRLAEKLGVAVTIGYGPRYLHSTGQLHKGGPANGVFLLLEGPDPTGTGDDLPVPGREYSFGRLFSAQAEGDARTLRDRGRPLVRLRAGGDVAADLRAWAASLRS